MQFPLSPLVAALLAAAMPAFPVTASAAAIGPIYIDDAQGGTSLVLVPGTTVTAGAGDAINVQVLGNGAGGLSITVIGGGTSGGVVVSDGGQVSLRQSTVQTDAGTALSASQANSSIYMNNSHMSSTGNAVVATDLGVVTLEGGGSVSGGGNDEATMRATDGGVITAKDLEIFTAGGSAVQVLSDARVELRDVKVSPATGGGASPTAAIVVDSAALVLTDSHVQSSVSFSGIEMTNDSVATIHGSVVEGGVQLWSGATAHITDSEIAGSNLVPSGVLVDGAGSFAELENVLIGSEDHPSGYGFIARAGGFAVARDVTIDAVQKGIVNEGGTIKLEGGTVRGNVGGLYAFGFSPSNSLGSTIEAVGTHVLADAAASVGVLVSRPDAHILLDDVTVDVTGEARAALEVTDGARLDAVNSRVQSQAAGSAGLQVQGHVGYGVTVASLSNTQLTLAAQDANGVESLRYAPQDVNRVVLSNASVLQTHDGVGFLVMGANHEIAVEHSQVLARSAGNESNGVLLKTQTAPAQPFGPSPATETEQVALNAKGAFMTGDVLVDSGYIDIDLTQNSVLNGAVSSGAGSVNSLSTDTDSVWNVRGNSTLRTLNNTGTVRFMSPDAQAGFKTLTVANYLGGGTLAMNTQLGDDSSLTDKLVIDGGTVSGATRLQVINAGGTGGLTTQGIRLVQAINGATTAADAFLLDAGSSGYRTTSGTLGLNGYEYFLVQGGEGGVASDWYLTSAVLLPEVEPPPPGGVEPPPGSGVDPVPPGTGVDPSLPGGGVDPVPPGSGVDPLPPGSGVVVPQPPAGGGGSGMHPTGTLQNVSPESGVHIGNQVAASRMFVHRLADRTIAQTARGAASLDGPAERIWMRTEGSRHTGLRMTQGTVGIDTDTATLQIGADLIRTRVGLQGVLMAGVMGGYGDARVRSTSRLTRPDTGATVSVDARGKVSGHSLGIYATAYANDATRLGAYADTWLQFGRYTNEINSELGAARYRSKTWSASLETGYAIQPFASESALGAMVVVPQAQVIYTRYNARDADLPSMTLQNADATSVSTRVGVRAYPLGNDGAAASLRPFLEANWLRNTGGPRANTESVSFRATPTQNAAELKIGVAGNVGNSLHVTGEIFGQAGSGDQRGYGGMLKVGYRW